jgi:lipid-A-disaccharide synthase
MIVIYKTGFFTYQIARRLVTLDSIGMVNIVAGRRTVPELIQHKANPAAIASHVCEIMSNEDLYNRMVGDLKTVRDKLDSGNAGRRAADAIQEAFPLC